VLYVAAWRL